MTTIPDDILHQAKFAASMAFAGVGFADPDRAIQIINEAHGHVAAPIAAERERCASLLERTADLPQEIRLHCGEMTAQEMRTVRAALRWMAAEIRIGKALPNP